jgi:Pyruvate/2-oxoacid:ferredoxin oxidoreductase delta subunit
MAIRNIVKIDEQQCDGCGQCIVHCAEGALQIVDGRARLVSESYCDGLGACLAACPQGAITIEQRQAPSFDEAAVKRQQAAAAAAGPPVAGCPGLQSSCLQLPQLQPAPSSASPSSGSASQLSHWPVQLALVRPDAPFLRGADLLLAADCAPLALADFHARLLRGRPVVMGCPKLDDRRAYVDKLRAIFQQAEIRSLTIVLMEVPCCGGLSYIARTALQQSGRSLPVSEITISIQGQIVAAANWPESWGISLPES